MNNAQLNLFWQVGAFIDQKISGGHWGDKVVEQFAIWLKEKDPLVKNFDRRNIYTDTEQVCSFVCSYRYNSF